MTTILRFDLGLRWTIELGSGRYFEEPLTEEAESTTVDASETDLRTYGFDYSPRFDWNLDSSMFVDTVAGFACTKVVARGEADYASKTVEIWTVDNSPINSNRYYGKCLAHVVDDDWRSVYQLLGRMRSSLILRSREILEPSIAPTITSEDLVTKAEVADPPQNVYDLPAGCKRVTTIDELYK